jgi:F-type H+-transporting ATPase subunit b
MIAKTAEDNRRALEQEAAAEADYRRELAVARTESSAIRDEVRATGRGALDDMRAHANDEVSGVLQEANDELKLASDAISGDLRSSVDTLSATLASRVLGVEVSGTSTAAGR